MSVPVAVRFDEELNEFLAKTVKENNTTKTDFIRQAVIEKLEDMYDIEMANYDVEYAETFFDDMDKLDRGTQKQIMKWIEKHLVGVDFPRSPGKYLTGNLSGYVRFRVSNYRIIAVVDDDALVITNLHVGHRSTIYKKQ